MQVAAVTIGLFLCQSSFPGTSLEPTHASFSNTTHIMALSDDAQLPPTQGASTSATSQPNSSPRLSAHQRRATSDIVSPYASQSDSLSAARSAYSTTLFNSPLAPYDGSGISTELTFTATTQTLSQPVASIYVQLGDGSQIRNSCYIRFDLTTNRIRLLNDAGTGWVTPVPGSSSIIHNSQCSIDQSVRLSIERGLVVRLTVSYTFFSSFAGSHPISMYSEDSVGGVTGWTRIGGWDVPTSSGAFLPSIASFSPTSGSMTSLPITLTAIDRDGSTDMAGLHILANYTLSYANGCYLYVNLVRTELYLLNDNTSRFTGPIRPGDSSTLQNSQCSVAGSSFSIDAAGDSVTVSALILFTEAAAGSQSLWTLLEDTSKTWQGWRLRGKIDVTTASVNAPPTYDDVTITPTTTGSFVITAATTDRRGPEAVEDLYLLINSTLTASNGCYIMLRRSTQRIYLLDDAGSRWQDDDLLGSDRIASNRSCNLHFRNSWFRLLDGKAHFQIEVSSNKTETDHLSLWLYIQNRYGIASGWGPSIEMPHVSSTLGDNLSLILSPGASLSTSTLLKRPSSTPWRVELYVHNWTTPHSQVSDLLSCPALGISLSASPNGALTFLDPGTFRSVVLPLTGRSAFLVRIQKLTESRKYALELWDLDGSNYILREVDVPQWKEPSASGCTLQNPTLEGFAPAFGFLTIHSTLKDVGTLLPLPSDRGDILDWQFEGNINDDSNSHWHTLLLAGAFVYTTGADTIVAKPVVEGFEKRPSWMLYPVVNTSQPVRLSAENSYSLDTHSRNLRCIWQQLGDPEDGGLSGAALIEDPSSCVTNISGLHFGPYRFQVTVTNEVGQAHTAEVELGAVTASPEGLVEYPDPRLNTVLGPSLMLGTNPWEWADRQHVEMAQYLWKRYEINGGTWRLESDLQSLNGIERRGTVYTVPGISNKLFGINTNFLEVFCGGTPGNSLGTTPYIVPMLRNLGNPNAAVPYPRLVQTCESDTELTFRDGWVWERPPLEQPGASWRTTEMCGDCGDWRGVLSTSNINYYDNALGHYSLYYKTGWRVARDSARWLADRWYRSSWSASGLGVPPRDLSFTSAYIRAEIDSTGVQSGVMWTILRNVLPGTCVWYGSSLDSYPDTRESAYCLAYHSLAALLDPDATSRDVSIQVIRDAYNIRWGVQQEAEGNYISRDFEGDLARVVEVADGSNRVTLHHGPAFPADYCGRISLEGSGARIWSDRVTFESDNTSFDGQLGKIIMLRGRLNGQPWSMVSSISPVSSVVANRITLVQPWRGDVGEIEDFAIMESQPAGRGYWELFMAETNSEGSLLKPSTLDRGAWYWCRVETGSSLVLDKPYVVEAGARGAFRRMTWQGQAGMGSQPFIMGILGWAFHLAADAIDETDHVTAVGYRSRARSILRWLRTYGMHPVTKGMRYGVGYSNCQGLDISPAYGCWSSDSKNERSYNIELMNLISRDALAFGSEEAPGFADELYTATYGKTGYASPMPGDGYFAEALDESGYTWSLDLATKSFGQAWGVGGGQTWPAVRLMLRK